MDLREHFEKIDLERLILLPVFAFLILVNASGAYSCLMKNSLFSDVCSTMQILHKGLMVCFYMLIVALFFMRIKPKATSRSFSARALAYAGTFTPFLLIFTKSPRTNIAPAFFSIVIMTCGMLFSIYSLKTLGRSFGITPQARALVQTGPYRFIRHPLYLGEIVAFGGAVLTGFTITKLGIFLLLTVIQSYRAVQEEKLLEETIPEYAAYKAATTRFIPGVL